MIRLISMALLCLLVNTYVYSQVNYEDVAVIINENSAISIEIGEYFQQQRNIPESNIIRIMSPTDEEISLEEFQQLIIDVKAEFTNNDIINDINYIVTTKGVPLRIEKPEDCVICNARLSVESRLSTLFSSIEYIDFEGTNPINSYYQSDANFTRAEFDIYLVSRLDAFHTSDIYNLIDESTPELIIPDLNEKTIIIDMINTTSDIQTIIYDGSKELKDALESFGWNVFIDSLPTVYDGDIEDVIGYIQWGVGPMDSYSLPANWSPNGISAALAFNTAQTFDNNEPVYESKTLAGHMVEEGYALGSMGYVGEVYLGESFPLYKIKAYFDPNINYNLAESYYQGIMKLGSNDVIIGDPKMSIFSFTSNVDNELIVNDNIIEVYPNPVEDVIYLKSEIDIEQVTIIDVSGKVVKKITVKNNSLEVTDLDKGTYILQLEIREGIILEKMVKL